MNNTSQPAKNIMETGSWADARSYRVACDCHHNQHDLDVWIEVVPESDSKDITVTFYKDIYVPFWKSGYNRLLEAWRVLFTGHATRQGDFIMNQETARNFCNLIQKSLTELQQNTLDQKSK
jgi:hypothetical protein